MRMCVVAFLAISGNKCCCDNTFSCFLGFNFGVGGWGVVLFLGLINIFIRSLLSIPLHRLELISFSATPGNKCGHGYTVFFVFGLTNIFMGFPYPAQIGADKFFNNTWQQVLPWQHCFMFLGLTNLSRVSLHSKPLHRFQPISFSATPGDKCCHGNTFFCFFGLYFCGFFAFQTPA